MARLFKWDGELCDSPEPVASQHTDPDFVTKTHRELTRISSELSLIRRAVPKHPWCADEFPCKFCRPIRDKHALLDDHLSQLGL